MLYVNESQEYQKSEKPACLAGLLNVMKPILLSLGADCTSNDLQQWFKSVYHWFPNLLVILPKNALLGYSFF